MDLVFLPDAVIKSGRLGLASLPLRESQTDLLNSLVEEHELSAELGKCLRECWNRGDAISDSRSVRATRQKSF